MKWATDNLGPRQAKKVEKALRAFDAEARTSVEVTDFGRFAVETYGRTPTRSEATSRLDAIRSKYDNTITGSNYRDLEADLRAAIEELKESRPEVDRRSTPEDRAARQKADERAQEQAKERAKHEARWKALLDAGPAGTGAVIIAELEENQSDPMTDYWGSKTVRRVAIGYRRGSRENFKRLREAAATFPETAHLGPGHDLYHVHARWSQEAPESGRFKGDYYVHAELHGKTFSTESEALAAVQAEADSLPEGVTYRIDRESVEHRDNYSMGKGNWLGVNQHSGWLVRSASYFPGEFEDRIAAQAPPSEASIAPVGCGEGFVVSPGRRPGVVEVRFEEKPEEEIRQELKSAGFRWARTTGCWYGSEGALPERYGSARVAEGAQG